MKNILIVSSIVLLSACGIVLKNAETIYSESKPTIYTNLDSAIASPKQQLLWLVFYENDSLLYNAPLTTSLRFDSTKYDALTYRTMCREYAILKLYRKQFDSLMHNLGNHETVDSFAITALAYNPGKSFYFVCHPKMLYLYGTCTLDEPKEYLHTTIVNFMGP
jgi:hypothetical protein